MPSYDNIVDAYSLSPAGGSVQFDTTGATEETNENTYNEGYPGIWLKLDVSSLLPDGVAVRLTVDCTGDSNGLTPYLDVWMDETGTFDPGSPDFSLLSLPNPFYGDGTTTPGSKDLELAPNADGSNGVYWIWTGDWNFTVQGLITVTWALVTFTAAQTDAASSIGETSATLNTTLDATGFGAGSYLFEYGTTTAYGSVTSSSSVASGFTGSKSKVLGSLTPNTTYHYRARYNPPGDINVIYGLDRTFTTLVDADPPTVDLEPADTITPTTADLHGTIDDNDADTTYNWFVCTRPSDCSEFDKQTPDQTLTAGSGSSSVGTTITGLIPGRRYFMQLTATNREGTREDHDETFTTPMADTFGDCATLLNDFAFDDCSDPSDGSDANGEDVLRVKDGQLAALNTTEAWLRSFLGQFHTSGGESGIDIYITLSVVDAKQGLLVAKPGGGYYGVRHDTGTIYLIEFDSGFAETILDSGSGSAGDGAQLGFRYEEDVLTAYLDGSPVATATGVTTFYTTSTDVAIYGEISNPTPFNTDIPVDGSCLSDTSSMGTISSGEIPGCCDLCTAGMNRYEWLLNQWQWNEHGSPWSPPVASGTDFDPCPGWRANLAIYPHGKFDCYNTVWNLGGDGGVDGPYPPWYVDPASYDSELDAIESAHSFFVYDGDYAHKIFQKLIDSLDELVTCDAEAVKYEGTSEGYSNAWGVWRPVDWLDARMDDLYAGFGCRAATVTFVPQIIRYR